MSSIRTDLEHVASCLRWFGRNQNLNFRIKKPNYMMPDLYYLEPPLPMNHQSGINVYMERIKKVLEKAYRTGRISRDELPAQAPDYLEICAF